MYPSPAPASLKQDPGRHAEWLVYNALESGTSNQFSAFYSVGWVARTSRYASDGEADFVLAHPERGILIIEVKGGLISYDGNSDQYYSTSRANSGIYPIKDPAAQASRSKFALEGKLRELPGWKNRSFQFAHAVCFPDTIVDRLNLHPELPREIVIDAADLRQIDACLDRIHTYWHTRQPSKNPLGGDGLAMLHQLLAPSWTLRFNLGEHLRSSDSEIRKLSERQVAILRGMGKSRRKAIEGGAGSGKTVLAIEKARHLCAQGFRVLLTCFNRPLGEHLKAETAGIANLDVATFHQVCVDMAVLAKVPLDQSGPKDQNYFDQVLPEALLAACGETDFRYDAIVVDEGQDFGSNYWVPLQCCLREPETGVLYIFFDNNQTLFRELALPDGMAEEAYQLTENFRNTRQIHAASVPYYEAPVGGGEMISCGPEGDVVFMRTVGDGEELGVTATRVLERLIEDKVAPRDIAILTGRSVDDTRFSGLARLGRVELTRDSAKEPNKVLVDSIYRFKGLERQVIILTDIDHLVTRDETHALYVGLTRARLYLVVVARDTTIRTLKARMKQELVHGS